MFQFAGVAGTGLDSRTATVREQAIVGRSRAELNAEIVDRIPDTARVVLIGEASHGTREFYQQRAELTKLLIEKRGFNAVAGEADWPDAFDANLYVRGMNNTDRTAEQALSGFKSRFPTWMWRNTTVVSFVEWLARHNATAYEHEADPEMGEAMKVGFYGLDVYSMHRSAREVIAYLTGKDDEAAQRARERYSCFDRFGDDGKTYSYAVGMAGTSPCEGEALAMLAEMLRREGDLAMRFDGVKGREHAFAASENARVVVDAEEYYRNMFFREKLTWNIRDTHMLELLSALRAHLTTQTGGPAKVVVWAHNSHLGDARATTQGRKRGKVNLGQLARQTWGTDEVYNIGFTTHTGTVAAADEWGEPVKLKRVRPSLPGSYERLLHEVGLPHFALDLRRDGLEAVLEGKLEGVLEEFLKGPMLERAIGVIYRPETERQSHYFDTWLPQQFDCIIHVDRTQAVHPLETHPDWKGLPHPAEDLPETFPFGV